MRILFICHNHPALMPGGTEVVARSLFRELRDRHGAEGLFLAAVAPPLRQQHPGTMLQSVGDAADELLVWLGHFDRFHLFQPDSYGLASVIPLVRELAPDIVHIHHALLFGMELFDLLRRAAPQAKVVFTAHDYFPICAREGELLTQDERLCPGPSPDACTRCIPGRDAMEFRLRDLAVRDAMADLDAFLVPSEFARDRFLANGWPAGTMAVLPNGIAEVPPVPHRPLPPGGRRDRFGFFGHINRIKGSRVLLKASRRLSEAGVAHTLRMHGGTEYQLESFIEGFQADLAAAPEAQHFGIYAAADLPRFMAEVDWVVMPSIWYENSPLVVMEAFRHGRPVILSGIGGMAELVRDGVDGLHAPPNDPIGLAEVLRRAAETPGLWDQLAANIHPPLSVAGMTAQHLALYRRLLGEPAAPPATPPAAAKPAPRQRPAPEAKVASRPKPRSKARA